MGIPILVSRSGFTAWGVDLARKAGLTLIGRGLAIAAGRVRVLQTLLDALATLLQSHTERLDSDLPGQQEEDQEVRPGHDDPEEVDGQTATLFGRLRREDGQRLVQALG